MKTNDALGVPQIRGHGGHRQRGCIGCQDAGLRNDVLDRSEHLSFHGQVFENGFQNEFGTGERSTDVAASLI